MSKGGKLSRRWENLQYLISIEETEYIEINAYILINGKTEQTLRKLLTGNHQDQMKSTDLVKIFYIKVNCL